MTTTIGQTAYKVVNPDYTSWVAKGKYSLKYTIGSIVEASPDTLGIFLFKYLKNIDMFTMNHHRTLYKILQVIMLSEMYDASKAMISYSTGSYYINKFYINPPSVPRSVTPPGTVCCHKIRVLKEVTLP